KVLQTIREASFYGIDLNINSIKLNWAKMQERKVMVSETLSKGVEMIIKGAKAQYLKGEAQIIDKHNVKVGDKVFTTKVIILAAGSEPVMLNKLPGFQSSIDNGHLIDSTAALELDEIPKELVIIGGGVIGIEFAVLYSELGTKVTILEGGPSILGPLDGEVKSFATKHLSTHGVKIITNARVNEMDGQTVKYELDGKAQTIKGDKVLLSVGRKPLTLDVDKILGVKLNERGGVEVNQDMQTSVSNVFAIGDVVGKSMLAHTAYKHAHILARAIEGVHTNLDMNSIPACVYTHPEIAVIGQTEEQLKENKVDYIKSVWQNTHVGKTLADGHTEGFTKLLVSKTTGEILGAHIVNDTASDMIAELAAVKELEGTVYELAATIHPHPSISEAIYEAAVHAVEQLKKLNK
ncbi:MAG: FAD-dependent oxidoreductase, partial [Mycoplasmataceae bacterium]|nr:FAD-dependent oxidoreductase [Mycoplasmataceae bacterium]